MKALCPPSGGWQVHKSLGCNSSDNTYVCGEKLIGTTTKLEYMHRAFESSCTWVLHSVHTYIGYIFNRLSEIGSQQRFPVFPIPSNIIHFLWREFLSLWSATGSPPSGKGIEDLPRETLVLDARTTEAGSFPSVGAAVLLQVSLSGD